MKQKQTKIKLEKENEIKENMLKKETILSPYATKTQQAILLKKEQEELRLVYFRDIDRILHSLAYTRYMDKTQVFYFLENDNISRRAIHVQLVSKIARTIGRSLNLNEDLIEAIALGHDLGHTPFGHLGEQILNEICKREGIGYFCHNAQSVRVLKDIENKNISIQTLDGILAHNGEILLGKYEPDRNKNIEKWKKEYKNTFEIEGYSKTIRPMTLEGCVVRISDIIAYVGRDIEDAILLGVISREKLPKKIKNILGDNNSVIIDTLIKDILNNSLNKPYLQFSEKILDALMELKQWNYEQIYLSNRAVQKKEKIEQLFSILFQEYEKKIKELKQSEKVNWIEDEVFYHFVQERTKQYQNNTNEKRIIIDYLAGQTDHFFLRECNKRVKGFKQEELLL